MPPSPLSGASKSLLHGRRSKKNLFKISVEDLNTLNQDKSVESLQDKGGITWLAEELAVDLSHGLNTREEDQKPYSLHDRELQFGRNVMTEVEAKTLLSLILEQLQDPVLLLLIVAATISTILGLAITEQRENQEWVDGVAIWVAIAIVSILGAVNEYRQDQQFRKLNAQKEEFEVTVIRDGKEGLIFNTELLVGDVLVLNTGDRVTADGVLFHNDDLIIDEASLTGESESVRKKLDSDPFCRSGTHVTDGSGRILVTAVGKRTEWGQTMALITGETDKTPLQEKLVDLAAAIGRMGLSVGICSFIILTVRWIIEKRGFPIDEINDDGPLQFFLLFVTIVVVAVPEGLPLAVTISLAYSMQKMMKDKNFVRVLSACETMGGATCICSDKTGTLTENRMTVVEGWFHGLYFNETPTAEQLNSEVVTLITENACLNSKAFLIDEENETTEFVGNRTECALLILARNWKVDYSEVRKEHETEIIKVYGFNSARKMSSIIVRRGNVMRLYNKGAAEMVLQRCTSYTPEYGIGREITDEIRSHLMTTIEGMASRGLRTLALTYVDLDPFEFSFGPELEPFDESQDGKRGFAEPPDDNLVLLAIVGIKDPVRREVPDAVEKCKRAGIFVRMVTGDNVFTARHIAMECGILTPEGIVMEGPDFRQRAENDVENLKKELPHLQVLARSSPSDKHTLVTLLRSEGEVVAVTGDGTNDAPALRESDVGLAMGIAGTEVAKEAADIVIMDDNFSSIVKAVLWGRSVLTNIRKFLQFQLTVNVVALAVAFFAAIVDGETPLNVLQLLWVNLIMDSLAALALATEDPTPDLLDKKPQGRKESLITQTMLKHILLQSIYQVVVVFFILYSFPYLFERYEIPKKDEFYYHYCYEDTDDDRRYKGERIDHLCENYLHCDNSTRKCTLYDEEQLDKLDLDHDFRDHIKDKYEDDHDDAIMRKNSLIFNAFIFMQVFNEFNCRKIYDEYWIFQGVFHSPLFCGITVGITALQVAVMLTPIGTFFKVNTLTAVEWVASILIGIGVIPFSLAIRYISKRHCQARRYGYESIPSVPL
eukprot:g78.t1